MPERRRVAFVAPFVLEATLRFLEAAARLEGCALALITQDDPARLPEELRLRLAAVRHVGDAMDPAALEAAVRALETPLGGRVERLLGVLEQLQEPLAVVRERLSIRGMDAGEARHFRDKAAMKARLSAHDLPCARHRLAEGPAAALAFAAECGYPLVLKPPAGAGSRGTFRVSSRGELERALAASPPRAGEPVLLEEFIQGSEHSLDTVTLGGRHVFHSISRYAPGPLEVMAHPWIQWTVQLPRRIDVPEYDDIVSAGRRALDVLGMVTGLSHMEWFRRPDGSIAISEVAARPPGAQFMTLLSWAHDCDFYAAWVRLMVHERFEPPPRRYSAGAAFLRGQGHGRIVAVHGIERVRRELGGLIVEARLPRVGAAASGAYDGDGHVIVRHAESEVVADALRRVVSLVRVELG